MFSFLFVSVSSLYIDVTETLPEDSLIFDLFLVFSRMWSICAYIGGEIASIHSLACSLVQSDFR